MYQKDIKMGLSTYFLVLLASAVPRKERRGRRLRCYV